MKGGALILFAFAFACACHASTVPAFFWSNTEFFKGKSQLNDLTNFAEVRKSLGTSPVNVELYVIVIDSQLEVEPFGIAPLKNLKNAVSGAVTSVMVPHAVGSTHAAALVAALDLPVDTSVTVVGSDASELGVAGVRQMTVEQLRAALANPAGLAELRNGVPDVLVISLAANGFESHDVLLGELLSAVKDVDYVAVYTASTNNVHDANQANQQSKRVMAKRFVSAAAYENYSGNDWWPDTVIEALIIGIFLIAVVLTGSCCTLGLQSVLKFDAELKLRKQM